MSTKAEAFLAVLPALQHMARFRGANREVVCRQRGVRPADLEAVVADVFGSWARVDEESLEELARSFGVTVPPYEPAKPGFIGAVVEAERPPVRMGRPLKANPVDRGQSTVDRKPEQAKPAGAAPTTESDPWTGHALQLRKARTYLDIFTAIAVRGWEKVKPVLATEFGVKDPAFRVWKLKYFGTGELAGPKLSRFHAWLRAQAGSTATESRGQTTEDGIQRQAKVPPAAPAEKDHTTPRSPVNTTFAQVLDLLADFEDWTEVGREPDAVVSGEVLTLFEGLLDQLMNSPHKRRMLEGRHARVFVAPDRNQLAVAFGAEGIPLAMADTQVSIPLRGWSALVGDTATEWRVAEIPATGVVHLVFERSGEGRAA